MSRAARTARGTLGAVAATLLAAASHALAGGGITWLAVVATAIVAAPLCVALAGRTGSLWRLALGVSAAQALFHWSFAGLGASTESAVGTGSAAASAHAEHLAPIARFVPAAAAAVSSADAAMWSGHALAAILTIALMHRGERAALALRSLVREALPLEPPAIVRVPERVAIRPAPQRAPMRAQSANRAPITHRGPPAPSFSH